MYAFALGLLAIFLVAVSCSEKPAEPLTEASQIRETLSPDALKRWKSALNDLPSIASNTITVAGVGANFGTASASQLFSSGDLSGSFVTIDAATFNALSVAQLRANFDVLIFTWISDPGINADWNTRLLPYMALGGGILFEDPGNISDLAPGVTASVFNTSPAGMAISAVVPGLTDGINNSFANNHIRFTAWDPALSPFITRGSDVVGLYGQFGAGCIVLTGPDQHFHGFRGAGGFAGNQYNLLLNEVNWVTHCVLEVDLDIKPTSCPNPLNTKSKGVLPVAVLGSASLDVNDIDISTVQLKGVAPLRSSVEDVATPVSNRQGVCDCTTDGADGFDDLSLKFDKQDIVAALGAVSDGDEVVLTLTGNLNDGTPITGEDCVVIIKK
jgi:hypothetical protein